VALVNYTMGFRQLPGAAVKTLQRLHSQSLFTDAPVRTESRLLSLAVLFIFHNFQSKPSLIHSPSLLLTFLHIAHLQVNFVEEFSYQQCRNNRVNTVVLLFLKIYFYLYINSTPLKIESFYKCLLLDKNLNPRPFCLWVR
jgi:hypothetical protein